jgi:leucyl-tRNA synthetase
MKRYSPKEIEPKWQKLWDEAKLYEASDNKSLPKKYILEFFPYPSGAAMHVGHVRNYTIGDALSRYWRMQGHNVLHPMGWDAFGLPAENYAIKTGISPQKAVADNVEHFKVQLKNMGFGYDWSREIDSTDPAYYKWTQWFFILLFNKGLAYQKESLQWWCPTDKTVLANEQVEAGKCWRCGNEVEKKSLKQWFFKITDYADRLLEDLDDLDWTEAIKAMQRNWIGRSKGASVVFKSEDDSEAIEVFTTRPDTLFGATFLVLAPEHQLVDTLTTDAQKTKVVSYVKAAQAKSDIERQETNREKTGVFTGSYAINPMTKEKIPIWIADYVLGKYGTGAIMAVPAHDERDFEFAKKFELPIVRVIQNESADGEVSQDEGTMINSGEYNGMSSSNAREKIVAEIAKNNIGAERINYRITDWLISRQRYWGAPIPIIHCLEHGAVPVPEDQLPVVLPEVESYEPSGDGRSPLANVPEFVNTTCPTCGKPATRETDTMDGFACSSWYFLRYADPKNENAAFDKDKAAYWLPVDTYIGGAEHAVMHLLYARMWTKVMYDEGLISFNEPFLSLKNQGMILAPDGSKMSKSKGNTIQPDELIADGYGADTIRVMELFLGPWNQAVSWSIEGMGGCYRFLQRVWTLTHGFIENQDGAKSDNQELTIATHKVIKKVSEDMRDMSFNTSVAALMEYVNELYRLKAEDNYSSDGWKFAVESLLQLLAPFAPHITEELWSELGHKESIHVSNWPMYDEKHLVQDVITLAVQVNGKVRAEISVAADASESDVSEQALAQENVQKYLEGSSPKKVIYVPGRLVSIVV